MCRSKHRVREEVGGFTDSPRRITGAASTHPRATAGAPTAGPVTTMNAYFLLRIRGVCLLLLLATAAALLGAMMPRTRSATVPDQLSYEGSVAVDGRPFTGNGRFKFALVDAAGAKSHWSNDGSSAAGSEPTQAVTLLVTEGRYTVALGDPALEGMAPIPDPVFGQPDLRLRVWFSDGEHTFQHLGPDEALVPVAYARRAGGVTPGAITATELASGAVTPDKFAPGAVLSNLLAAGVGSVQFSTSPTNEALLQAGMVPLGTLTVPGESWTTKTYIVPPARVGAHAHWSGSEVLIVGGTTGESSGAVLAGFRYAPRTGQFTPLPTTNQPPFPARGGSTDLYAWATAWTGEELLVWNTHTRSGRRTQPQATRWSAISDQNAPTPRTAATTLWTGSEWIVWGGFRASTSLADGACYDPAKDTWRPMSTAGAPPPRNAARAVWTGTKMLMLGGERNAPGSNTVSMTDIWSYDPTADEWALVPVKGTRLGSAGIWGAFWTGSRLLAFGVASADSTQTYPYGAEFDPATGLWKALPVFEPMFGLSFASAVWAGREIIVYGGRRTRLWPETGVAYDSRGFAYEWSTRSWREISDADAPVGRQSPAAVWTGTEVVVWGGSMGVSQPELNDGGRYAPDRDRWLPITVAPLRRVPTSVAWTGSEILVWGGVSTASGRYAHRSGARLDWKTGRWFPMATRNAPEARTGHSSVWTGKEWILWGGFSTDPYATVARVGGALETGARYDPVADRWISLPRDDAPSARGNHTAIWTGREMIVWGGATASSGSSTLGTGARYDPIANRWTALPATLRGAPLPGRARHAAIWTGRDMLVWGGLNATNGLRFDPEANIWSALSRVGQPSGASATISSSSPAFWTGAGMLAYGGSWGLYDPTLDAWRSAPGPGAIAPSTGHIGVTAGPDVLFWSPQSGGATRRFEAATTSWIRGPTANAPSARTGASLVWVGDALVVIGGEEASASIALRPLEMAVPIQAAERPLYLYARPSP